MFYNCWFIIKEDFGKFNMYDKKWPACTQFMYFNWKTMSHLLKYPSFINWLDVLYHRQKIVKHSFFYSYLYERYRNYFLFDYRIATWQMLVKKHFVEQRNYQNTLKSMKLNYKNETNKVLIITWHKYKK